jgi:PAS domain S-box-containing protein
MLKWVRASGQCVEWDNEGKPVRFLGTHKDITERKTAEEALRESQRKLETLMANLPGMAYRCRNLPIRTMEFVSSGCVQLTGYLPAELLDDSLIAYGSIIHPDSRQRVWADIQSEIAADRSFQLAYQIITSGGDTKWVWEQGQAIVNDFGEPVVLEGFISDITERMNANEALRRGELRFRSIFNQTYQLTGIVSLDGTLMAANQTSSDFIGAIDVDVVGKPFWDTPWWLHSSELRAWLREAIAKAAHGEVKQRMVTHVSCDGEMHDFDFSIKPVFDEEGHVVYLIAESRDITDYRIAEEALRESEQQASTITENSADAIFVLTREGTCTYVNKAACSLLGYTAPELLQMTMGDLLPHDQREAGILAFQRLLVIGRGFSELELLHKDGHAIPVDLNTVVLPNGLAYGSCRDLTVRRQLEQKRLHLEAQLRQSQKLESIGTLASGVAHEVNNPLMGMINYAELIGDRASDDTRIHEYSSAIIAEGNRIANIVRKLLAFSRQDDTHRSLANVGDIIRDSLTLIQASLRKSQIQLCVDTSDNLPKVICNSQQIQQVLVNLISNAQAALNDRYPDFDEGKRLSISASTLTDAQGNWLRIIVEDLGTGIPEDSRDRVFDPFFTSKSRAHGTGLGLSISHEIIADHRGRLSLESQENEFTRFHVDLPLP